VIDSGIASAIPAAKGRCYVRLLDGDPIEFQSARVACRRPISRLMDQEWKPGFGTSGTLPHFVLEWRCGRCASNWGRYARDDQLDHYVSTTLRLGSAGGVRGTPSAASFIG